VQAAIVVVDAAGHLMGALRFEEALWVSPFNMVIFAQ
jgi:hypothetical protein